MVTARLETGDGAGHAANGRAADDGPRVALVTGGAGDIGAATARALAEDGARVVLADRDGPGVERAAATLRADGLDAVGVACDQTRPEQIERLFAVELDGRLDVCFANAGYGRYGSVLDVSPADWQRHVDVNLTGTFLVVQAAARRMVAEGRGGAIVVNASTAATHPTALFSAYAASKAGVAMLARSMAEELGRHGIRVNAVCPGVVETGMTSGLLDAADGAVRARITTDTAVERLGRPADVAAAVRYLAGPDSGYVTGVLLPIEGGQTMRGQPRWFRPAEGDEWALAT